MPSMTPPALPTFGMKGHTPVVPGFKSKTGLNLGVGDTVLWAGKRQKIRSMSRYASEMMTNLPPVALFESGLAVVIDDNQVYDVLAEGARH